MGKGAGSSLLHLLASSRSTYDFSGKAVPDRALMGVLEAARMSPSFLNSQPWEFVVVKNRGRVEKLLSAAHYGVYRHALHKSVPPVAVAFILKKKCWEGNYGYPGTDKPGIYEAYLSLAMPALSMRLQAQEQGLSTCILSVDQYAVGNMFELEKGDIVPLVVCLGYGKEKRRRQPDRKPLEQVVKFE